MNWYDRDGNRLPDDWMSGRTAKWYSTSKRVASTVIGESCRVSTVWLGLDHALTLYRHTRPIIFETMIFGGPYAGDLHRYATEEDALRGHLTVLDNLRHGREPFTGLEVEAEVVEEA